MVSVTLCQRKVIALIDTGAQLTFASEKIFQLVPELHKYKLQKSKIGQVLTADEGKLNVNGVIEVPAFIDDKYVRLNIHIVENLNRELILGVDFLKRYQAVIDFSSRRMKLKGEWEIAVFGKVEGFSV